MGPVLRPGSEQGATAEPPYSRKLCSGLWCADSSMLDFRFFLYGARTKEVSALEEGSRRDGHASLSDMTRGLIDALALSTMKLNGFLINAARGAI